jgi:DNA polymerase III subunit gamma/tau
LSRTALARTYRPRSFAEVSSQEHVSQTLRAAVRRDRVAHAYLFCGPRGVGKTTLARVLAMALNCPQRTEEGEPCGICESCERIWSGRTSLDVVEIDAASNRGVDDARELRERAMYAPSEEDRFKVYIIDEAHMLTREAWNALLKILEEPPPRVIFVFATTEPQKIQQQAAPILSRCQRFDFRRVGTGEILTRMREVLGAEGYAADDTTLLPIAQKADGGMRDALSLLDQVLSFTEGAPTAEDVRRVLGLVGTEMYLELADIIADHRHADVFRFVGELMDSGYDLAEFYRGLADFLRTLLVARLDGVQAIEVGEDMAAGVEAAAQRFEVGDLLRMLAQVAELDADGRFRKSGQPRILVELLLLRFSFLDRTVDLERLLAGLGGSPAESAGGDGGGGAGKAARPPEELPRRARSRSEEAEAAGPAGRDPAVESGASAAVDEPALPEPRGAYSPDAGPEAPAPPASPAQEAAAAQPPADRPDTGPTEPGEAEERTEDAFPVDATALRRAWGAMLKKRAGLPPGMPILLQAARPEVAGPGQVRIDVPDGSPVAERLDATGGMRALEDALGEALGTKVRITLGTLAPEAGSAAGPAPRITAESARADRLRRLVEEEPLLAAAVEAWDLELEE